MRAPRASELMHHPRPAVEARALQPAIFLLDISLSIKAFRS
jgi:hypothetical protein